MPPLALSLARGMQGAAQGVQSCYHMVGLDCSGGVGGTRHGPSGRAAGARLVVLGASSAGPEWLCPPIPTLPG